MQNGGGKKQKFWLGEKTWFGRSCKNFLHPGPLTRWKQRCLTSPYSPSILIKARAAPLRSAKITFCDSFFSSSVAYMREVPTSARDYFAALNDCLEVPEAPVGLQNANWSKITCRNWETKGTCSRRGKISMFMTSVEKFCVYFPWIFGFRKWVGEWSE